MPRIACLHIPQLQIAAQHKNKKEENQALQRKLITALINCSPKVKALETGAIILDASGLVLRGGENTFCHHVLKTCSKASFIDAYIGIADSAFTATVASRANNHRITIVPTGEDVQFLAPLSIKYLELAADIEDVLITLGITTMGKLASLPASSLNERFCKAGEIIWKPWELAQGIDNCKPTLPETEELYECFLDLGGAVSTFNEIIFALKSMLDRLTCDLKQSSRQVQELILSLYHESNKFDERILQLIRPSNETKFLLEIIRLSLAAHFLKQELTAIKLSVSKHTQEQWKQAGLDLKQYKSPNNSADDQLTQAEISLLQRFTTRLGKNKIFTAQANDQYINENAGTWIPVNSGQTATTQCSVLPLDTAYLKDKIPQNIMPDLVLRQILPPLDVLVQLKDTKPAAINYKKRWYKIKSITEPEYLSCQWWSRATAKYYYKILVEPTHINSTANNNQEILLMLLVHDKLKDNWCIEGLYD